jgi:FAD/FMN-containing dehydrogenase
MVTIDRLSTPRYFQGEFVLPGDPRFEELRWVVDHRHDATPAVIARCASVVDVQDALASARELGLAVAVRGGRHGFQGNGTIDGGMVIDLALMRDVHVDLARRTARIRPAALNWEVLRATAPHGLAAAGGGNADISYGGSAPLSGQGLLTPRHGNACDNILSADIVLANGEWVTASAVSHPDLFWAIRGAGHSFGVITSIEVPLHPVTGVVHYGEISYERDSLEQTLANLEARDTGISEDCLWWTMTNRDPMGTFHFSVAYTHVGADQTIRDADIEHLHGAGPVASEEHAVAGYLDYLCSMDNESLRADEDHNGWRSRTYFAGCDLRSLSEPAVAAIFNDLLDQLDATDPALSSRQLISVQSYKGGFARQPSPPNVYTRRTGHLLLACANYDDPDHDAAHKQFSDAAVMRFVEGGLTLGGRNVTVPNFVSELDAATAREIYGDLYPGLQDVKRRYDPDNTFRHAVPIEPAPEQT